MIRQPADGGFGGRFYLVGYLPTYAAALFVLVLVWAGARGWSSPGRRLSFKAAWVTAAHLSLGEAVAIALGVMLLAVVLHPLQFALMNAAEGSWPAWPATHWARQWQQHRKNHLTRAAQLPAGPDLTDEAIQRAGAAGYQLRRRFPRPEHLLRPTALGNILAAMEDTAGRAYGLDAVTAWPRLYPVLGEQFKSLVDDRRDALDSAVRMSATMSATALVSLILLLGSGWWTLLVLLPAGIAALAYNGAVQSALAYAETVHVAFDLHRADLLTALRMELPARLHNEYVLNQQWCDLWRQGIPLPSTLQYRVSSDNSAKAPEGTSQPQRIDELGRIGTPPRRRCFLRPR
jgi:hypothetical protein